MQIVTRLVANLKLHPTAAVVWRGALVQEDIRLKSAKTSPQLCLSSLFMFFSQCADIYLHGGVPNPTEFVDLCFPRYGIAVPGSEPSGSGMDGRQHSFLQGRGTLLGVLWI